jgi:signal peptidase II
MSESGTDGPRGDASTGAGAQRRGPGKLVLAAGTALGFLILDQATKVAVRAYIDVGREEIHLVPKFLSFVHAKNTGAAFSAFDGFEYRMPMFYMFTVIAVGVLVAAYRELQDDEHWGAIAVGLVASGALGNFIDRLVFQEVTDFIRVYGGFEPLHSWLISKFRTDTWPIWNVADAAIFVGVALFVLPYFRAKDKAEPVDGGGPVIA